MCLSCLECRTSKAIWLPWIAPSAMVPMLLDTSPGAYWITSSTFVFFAYFHHSVFTEAMLFICRWADGYSKRFGLHYVDFNSKFKDRYVKQSATWLKSYIGAHRNTYKGKAYIIPPIHTPLPPTTPNLPDEPSNDNNPPNSPAPPATPSLLPCDADVSCTWLDYLYTAINVYADNIRSSIYSQQSLAPSADKCASVCCLLLFCSLKMAL